jgi:hypothetical protein
MHDKEDTDQASRDRICKPFKEPMNRFRHPYGAWQAGTTNRVVVPACKAEKRFLGFLKSLQIRAQGTSVQGAKLQWESVGEQYAGNGSDRSGSVTDILAGNKRAAHSKMAKLTGNKRAGAKCCMSMCEGIKYTGSK